MTNPKKNKDVPAMRPVMTPISQITPYPNNPRTHPQAEIDLLAAILRKHGVDQPIVMRKEDGFIIKGHGRRLAALAAGMDAFPVVWREGLSEDDARAMRIDDNAIPLLAGWDKELVQREIILLKTAGYDVLKLGFPEIQLRAFGMAAGTMGADPDKVTEPPKRAVSRRGDVWLLGEHRLVCGDATSESDVAVCLAGAKPHLMISDPPYGVSYNPGWRVGLDRGDGTRVARVAEGKVRNDDRSDWSAAWKLFGGDVAYIWCASMTNDSVIASLEKTGLIRRTQIIWVKEHFTIGRGDYHWQHECVWYAVRKGATGHWAADRKQTTVWRIGTLIGWSAGCDGEKSEHGTQKPIECMRRPMENNSRPGDAVYDPFVGSGTTIIAAEQSRRRALAMELDPAYVDVCIRRWEEFAAGKKATLEATGRTFEETAAVRARKAATRAPGRKRAASPPPVASPPAGG